MEEKQINEDLIETEEIQEPTSDQAPDYLDPERPSEDSVSGVLPEEPAEKPPDTPDQEPPGEEASSEAPSGESAHEPLGVLDEEPPEEDSVSEALPEEPADEPPDAPDLEQAGEDAVSDTLPTETVDEPPDELDEEPPSPQSAAGLIAQGLGGARFGALEEGVPSDHPMNDLMEEALSFQKLRQGDIVDGQIVSVSPTEILVDVGAKSEGVVRGKELEGLGREGLEDLQIGDTIPVYVVRAEDRDGNLVLSIRRAEEEADWRKAKELYDDGEAFESSVAGFNKGGLIVRLGKLRGFVPASQLSRKHQGKQQQQPEERWARLVGIPIRVKIIEINRSRKRLILSERAALRQWRESQKARLLEELREGEVRQGEVSSLSEFGAFVDLGGADGLVHLSELSWNRSVKPRDVLEVGQEVEVYVLGVNREKKRIALSLKRLEPEPWSTVESRYYVGQLVEGTITRLTNFGAFALVNDEIEGLIHISELSDRRINHPQEVVQEGEQHVMRIIRIDPKRRRMGLSLMRVADPAYADLDWRAELAGTQASQEADEEDFGDGDSLVGEDAE
jgi:small subunit ribosomal protein S1